MNDVCIYIHKLVNTMDSVSNILGIDKVNMSGKMIVIEEGHGSNANFVLNSIVFNALKKNQGICFVLFHNTFNHYHNIGMKLGYNLAALKEKGKVTVVESMTTAALDTESIRKDGTDKLNPILVESASNRNVDLIYNLFTAIRDKYHETKEHSESVVIVIDDLSHLFDLGFSLADSILYVRYLRSLAEIQSTLQLCILIHAYEDEFQSCAPNMLASGLKHMAHIVVTVKPLKTGHSNDASGTMAVNWTVDSIRKEYRWPQKSMYLYKLMDRQVKVYAPGSVTVSS